MNFIGYLLFFGRLGGTVVPPFQSADGGVYAVEAKNSGGLLADLEDFFIP